MKILFCNIAHMLHYEGNTERDILPTGAGSWVKENADAHEKWNFLNCDGYCYGFVQNPAQFRLERFEGVSKAVSEINNITIIWCAPQPSGKTAIVGWYENATMYRDYQSAIYTKLTGLDRVYFTKAKAEDCYLLPVELRTFEIERASVAGKGHGFGQQNYWYADSAYAKEVLIPQVISFLNMHKHKRINRLDNFFSQPDNLAPLTEKEANDADFYYNNYIYDAYLPLGYRSYASTKSADDVYLIGTALRELHQYTRSIEWFEKSKQLEGEKWDIMFNLIYLYAQIGQHEKSIQIAKGLLTYQESQSDTIRDEIYSTIADNYMYQGNIKEAINWLDRILSESTNAELIEHTKLVKEDWATFL